MNKYFIKQNKTIIFKGDILKLYIPKRYENRKFLTFGEPNVVLGICEFDICFHNSLEIINKGLVLPSMISTIPSKIYSETRRNVDCFVFEYYTNQPVILNSTLVKNGKLAYLIFMEMISLGNIPSFLSYSQMAFLFDTVVQTTGINLNVNHSIFEMIYSHLFRDSDNTSIKYRYTDMKKDPIFIELRSISEGPDSATASLYGSYSGDGLASVLTQTFEDASELEEHLRS